MSLRCEGQVWPYDGQRCRKQYVTTRKSWRFGDKAKGEPAVVDVKYRFCEECAALWDEASAEVAAEAAAS